MHRGRLAQYGRACGATAAAHPIAHLEAES
jgi:hypothetical protein